jgi:hypothetical protein
MRNWRTTLIGAALAAVTAIALYQQSGGDLSDWKQYAIPVLLAFLGYLAKDAGVTGSVKLLIACLCLLSLPACAVNGAGQKTFLGLTQADWTLVSKDAGNAAVRSGLQAGLISYGTRRAVTAAKQPINVQP